ncbi:NUDIX domain-containing protein [Actinotalea fermentans]|uniref:NTP pyrophosphohydrolase n=1 Tax=Actinotalea fermentans TaxID=43671 RepID=A0A511YVD2_9CELL|nr:NUDIX hydrolase [Actinotalea fermentans]KGM17187.1 ADP-ribose pyrophosphatase [Actinotalea fermentans ATCC 43279 = JCM 9966 = DSM 3133]GEN79172.1 NTP pyrophosphohydrolase [Actinotalea fermentans]
MSDAVAPADVPGERPVLTSDVVHRGLVWDVVRETVELGPYRTVVREYVRHPGAVAVIALDDDDRVLLLRQYRHPAGAELWEPPAGLLDVPGEDPVAAARRELAEEADLTASQWWLLAEYLTSPGGSDESLRVYLARGLAEVPAAERHHREDEEADMEPVWVPLDDAVTAVLAGRLRNPSTAVGVLAAASCRARGWTDLRPVDRS